jgi:hypothetical protein
MSDEIFVLGNDEHIDLQAFYPPVVCAVLAGVLAEQLGVLNFLSQAQHLKAQSRSNAVDDTLLAGVPHDTLIAEKHPTARRLGRGRVRRLRLSSDAVCR